jgi:hypothetical protein
MGFPFSIIAPDSDEATYTVLQVDGLDVLTVMAELGHRDPTATEVKYWTRSGTDIKAHHTCMDCMLRLMPRRRDANANPTEMITVLVQKNALCILSFDAMRPEFQCPRCRASLVTRNPEWRNVFDPP